MPRMNTDLIAELQDKLSDARELLDDIRRAQNDDSDVSNEEHIGEAIAALDNLDGHVGDLVP